MYVEHKKSNKKNKGIATENRIVVIRQGKGEGEGQFGMDMNTLLYLKWVTKDLLHSTWNSAHC